MCIVPLGYSLPENPYGNLIDRVLGEQAEARRLVEADDAESAAMVLESAAKQMRQQATVLLEQINRTEHATALIKLRTTYGGRVTTD